MILGYTLPNAKEKITGGTKIHSLRTDRQNRWIPGREIHHATGTRSPLYECFLKNKVKSTQQVLLVLLKDELLRPYLSVTVDRRRLSRSEVFQFAINDGFESEQEMMDWFFNKPGVELWGGKCIHWTRFKY